MDFILYIVIGVMCFWFGWHIKTIMLMATLSQDPEKYIKILEQIKRINAEELVTTPTDAILLSVEETVGMVYLFKAEDNRFVAQGPTIETALKAAAERFPGKKFWHPQVEDSQTT